MCKTKPSYMLLDGQALGLLFILMRARSDHASNKLNNALCVRFNYGHPSDMGGSGRVVAVLCKRWNF